MQMTVWLSFFSKLFLGAGLLFLLGFVAVPLILAAITLWRDKRKVTHDAHPSTSTDPTETPTLSSLYAGRVWHARLLPKHHGFDYPLFVFALDLEEVDELFDNRLWPLSLIVSFRCQDHLKNGEGAGMVPHKQQQQKQKQQQTVLEKHEIANRVCRLVAERTKNVLQPTLETHRVICVTHLCYYGYCFNPITMYYLQNKSISDETKNLDVVVAEVSNTPWNEMHCYVLHPSSVDQVQVRPDPERCAIRYIWPKRFHVSPFMEMNYNYDWTFTNFQLQSSYWWSNNNDDDDDDDPNNTETNNKPAADKLLVQAAMKRDLTNQEHGTMKSETHFTANVRVFHQGGMHPFRIAWQLIYFPIYCFIIQLWIHYEAFWLFVKGIAFVPHPNETETGASAVIGAIMGPLFALKDKLNSSSSPSSANSSASRAENKKTE